MVDRSDRMVAVIGASADRAKFGNKAVRAYTDEGYTVWPVNPKGGTIEDWPVFESIDALPALPHRVTIYLYEPQALETLEALARAEQRWGHKITAVYLNPGVDTPAVLDRAAELDLKAHPVCSIRAIGRVPRRYSDE